MQEIILDEQAFEAPAEVHAYLATELGFPAYYGANLDALNDCLGDVCEPTTLILQLAEHAPEESPLAAWFPKLAKVCLRASGENEFLGAMVDCPSLQAIQRILAEPGTERLLEREGFVTCALVSSV